MLHIGYYALLTIGCFIVGGLAVMLLVSFALHSWMPTLVMLGIIISALLAFGFVFIIITTLQWLQDKDSLW